MQNADLFGYDTYSRPAFADLLTRMHMESFAQPQIMPSNASVIVPSETAQNVIVPFETAQIPNVLFATGWTNHQIIMSRCKKDEERLFYMLYANKEHLENKELERVIKTDTMSPMMVMQYKEQLKVGSVLQRSLEEYCNFLNK